MIVMQLRGLSLFLRVATSLSIIVLGGCATTSPDAPERTAAVEVNEAGEYVFEDEGWRDEVVCKRQRLARATECLQDAR